MRVTDSRGFLVRALRGGAAGLLPAFFRLLMTPLAAAYGPAMRLRRWAYRRSLLRVHKLDVPVISVGNLTVGGTGKTPTVAWIVRRLLAGGKKPAILSRGYGPSVSPDAPGKNDEALMLKQLLPDSRHYVDADRVRGGQNAVAEGADCLILDDGFQHVRVHRDVEIVLLDALDPFGGRLLPAGTLREPRSCLREADAVILTRVDTVPQSALERLREIIGRLAPDSILCETTHRPAGLAALGSAEPEPPSSLAGRKVCLFCGIGNPRGFLRTVELLGATVVSAHFLPDHFAYRERDLARIARDGRQCGAELAVTTEKDAVKIGDAWPGRIPLRVLRITVDFVSGREALEALLWRALS